MVTSTLLTGCKKDEQDKTEDGRTIIRMAHWDQGGKAAEEAPLKLIKEEFEKTHPEYCLEYTLFSGYESQFLNIMASGDIPDIFLVPDGDFGAWVTTGLMEDLTPYINASAKKDELAHTFLWSPETKTSGTVSPINSCGRVY